MNANDLWQRYQQYLFTDNDTGLRLDISRMPFEESDFTEMADAIATAMGNMAKLEKGAIANKDENRMVGHYWLRAPKLAPESELTEEIESTVEDIKTFSQDVFSGTIAPPGSDGFYVVLVVGIGGSALGPQFVSDALGQADDPTIVRFIDNTDPDGIDRVLNELGEDLASTLTIVISKSGGTKETRNGMVEVAAAYEKHGLDFAKHAVAITGEGSALSKKAEDERWLRIFPMWDWVGGRTSETSAVGLLPAALQGVDIDELLAGARACDELTRRTQTLENPAALMALMWYVAGNGQGDKDMVVLPYCDRLVLFSRYLQQLVMESLGKQFDRSGNEVDQGLTVYGNKGSTDQHAFVQQLRDGLDRFFVTFIEVLQKRNGESLEVESGVTSGDYLHGFLHGTRQALWDRGRSSMTITVNKIDTRTVGVLTALFERAVGLYAELININAYHQPGVEAGKQAAGEIIDLKYAIMAAFRKQTSDTPTAMELAEAIKQPDRVEDVHHLLTHLAANAGSGVKRVDGHSPKEARYRVDS